MIEVINLEKLSRDGFKQPANDPNKITPDNITHAQLRYNTFTSSYVIQGTAVSGSNSTFEFNVTSDIQYSLYKLYCSTDGTNYNEWKSYGGTNGRTLNPVITSDIYVVESDGDIYHYDAANIEDAFDFVTTGGTLRIEAGTYTINDRITLKNNVLYDFRSGAVITSEVNYITEITIDLYNATLASPSTEQRNIVRRTSGAYAIEENETWTIDFNTGASFNVAISFEDKTLTFTYVVNTEFDDFITAVNADSDFRDYFDALSTFNPAGQVVELTETGTFTTKYNLTQSNNTFYHASNSQTVTILGNANYINNSETGHMFIFSGNSTYEINFNKITQNGTGSAVNLNNGFTSVRGTTIYVNNANGTGIITNMNDVANSGYMININRIYGIGQCHQSNDYSLNNPVKCYLRNCFFEITSGAAALVNVSNTTNNGCKIFYQNCLFKNNIDILNSHCIEFAGGNDVVLIGCGLYTRNASSNSVSTLDNVQSVGTVANRAVDGTETVGTVLVDTDFIIN